MKKLHLFLICIFLCNVYLQAQVTETRTPTSTVNSNMLSGVPHAKGKWQFYATVPLVSYKSSNEEFNGVDVGDENKLMLDLGATRFFGRNIGGGVQFMYDNSKTKSEFAETVSTDWSLYANFTYQREISDVIGIMFRAGPGIGGLREKYTNLSTNITQTEKISMFGVKAEIAFPWEITQDGTICLVPSIFYRNETFDYEQGKEKQSRYGLSLKMFSYLFCGEEMRCDAKTNYRWSANWYDQGSSYLGITTRGMISGGKNEFDYDNPVLPKYEEKIFNTNLGVEYMYYFIDNLAFGTQVKYRSNTVKSDPDYETVTSRWSLDPTAEFNFPGKNGFLRNTGVRASYSIGAIRVEDSQGTVSNEEKFKKNGWSAAVFHNFGLSKHLSLNLSVGYDSETIENKETAANEEWKYDGIYVGAGFRVHF